MKSQAAKVEVSWMGLEVPSKRQEKKRKEAFE